MKWLTLIGDEKLDLEQIKEIKHFGSVRAYDVSDGRYCVEYETEHIMYDYFNDMTEQYNESERKIIPFDNPRFVMVVYKSADKVKEIIQQDNYLRDVFVDNDRGAIVPIMEFIRIGMPMKP
jgi:hypothetical protein